MKEENKTPVTKEEGEKPIKVIHLTEAGSRYYWWFTIDKSNYSIAPDKIELIKRAIEKILNNLT